jgi:hypothetical protein
MATIGSPDDTLNDAELKEQASLLVKLSSSNEPRPLSVEFLHSASESDLQHLEADSHRTVAIAAAWERVRRVLPRDSGVDTLTGSRDAVYRFAGFLEGRLRVRVPELWLKAVLTASVTSQDLATFQTTHDDLMSEHHFTKEVQMPVSTNVVDQDGGLSIRVGRQESRLPPQFVAAFRQSHWSTIAEPVFSAGTCIIALYEYVPVPYTLYCIRTDGGGIQWTREVWAANRGVHYQGPSALHRVWLLTTESTVVVFGIASDAAYVEEFTLAEGENTCRFSTSHEASRDN